MNTREQMMDAFLAGSGDLEVGSAPSADPPRADRQASDCGSAERDAATWIPQRRYSVPVEALRQIWRGRRRGGLSE